MKRAYSALGRVTSSITTREETPRNEREGESISSSVSSNLQISRGTSSASSSAPQHSSLVYSELDSNKKETSSSGSGSGSWAHNSLNGKFGHSDGSDSGGSSGDAMSSSDKRDLMTNAVAMHRKSLSDAMNNLIIPSSGRSTTGTPSFWFPSDTIETLHTGTTTSITSSSGLTSTNNSYKGGRQGSGGSHGKRVKYDGTTSSSYVEDENDPIDDLICGLCCNIVFNPSK